MLNIKGVIFDLDGTLANTLTTIAHFANAALVQNGFVAIEEKEYRYMVGDGAKKLVARMLEKNGILTVDDNFLENFNKVYPLYNKSYDDNFLYLTSPYDGIIKMLELLFNAGIKIAVLSNKPHDTTLKIVAELFSPFVSICYGKRENVALKPNPQAVDGILLEWGIDKSECLYVGDTGTDMQTGKNAGLFTIGVLWGFRDYNELYNNNADFIAKEPSEISELALRLNSDESCSLCPKKCGAKRQNGDVGFCGGVKPYRIKAARSALHFWEEPCFSGEKGEFGKKSSASNAGKFRLGSGTVFFSGCCLRCVFCQNREISHENFGKEVSVPKLTAMFLNLQEKGAYNINLVTGFAYVNEIVLAVKRAKEEGLNIPVIYNSSGYESVETIKKLNGTVDVYMPDFKYFDDKLAQRYSKVSNYVETAKLAVEEMFSQTGECEFDDDGIMTKGTLVRILLLPSLADDAKKTIKYLYDKYGDKIYISLMSQYTPFGDLNGYEEIQNPIERTDYNELVAYAQNIGVENGFIQEEDAVSESFIPPFDLEGVL